MIESINVRPSKKQVITNTVVGSAVGAGIGAGASYLLQTQAIKKAKKAQEAVNATGLKGWINKAWTKAKDLVKLLKNSYTNTMDTIATNGKVSKAGIAKCGLVGAGLMAVLAAISAFKSSKKEN